MWPPLSSYILPGSFEKTLPAQEEMPADFFKMGQAKAQAKGASEEEGAEVQLIGR